MTARRRSEEHTSELQSPCNIVCRLLLEKKQRGCDSGFAKELDQIMESSDFMLHERTILGHIFLPPVLHLLPPSEPGCRHPFFFQRFVIHQDLHSFPTRRSSD